MVASALVSCSNAGGYPGTGQYPAPEVDFFQTAATTVAVEKKYPGMIEGSANVDIKAQVSGYLEAIFVKEGDYVTKGQALFKIKGDVFNEQVNNSQAALRTALANQANAKLEVEKIKPLVEGNVVSKLQLETAKGNYEATTAQVAQAKASLGTATINADFSVIKSPVSGYIGRIPNRIGNLVTPSDAIPLTTLSDINTVFVYFSMSEAEYLSFMKDKQAMNGNTVNLIMADGSVYEHKGKLEIASGNIDRATGSIALKAVFSNPDKLLRSGGSGRVILNKTHPAVVTIPMASVRDIQNKYFVFVLADSNKVSMRALEIADRSGEKYLVSSGVQSGEKVALTSIESLVDGMPVVPKMIAIDSLGK
ncbi:membrane fusion protein, multidrug efflux system [Chitinophaga sp. CF118]|nr:membrane fusion protein, multidrug efflux system [Chitinophaga sp. CF118]